MVRGVGYEATFRCGVARISLRPTSPQTHSISGEMADSNFSSRVKGTPVGGERAQFIQGSDPWISGSTASGGARPAQKNPISAPSHKTKKLRAYSPLNEMDWVEQGTTIPIEPDTAVR